tara:strand:- start:376 stop:621 length:246 start_codon:yes stop_codon:yes gene_type:complete
MKSAEYETIDAGKIQATKGTILSCIIDANANMSETQSNKSDNTSDTKLEQTIHIKNNMYQTINEQEKDSQKTKPNRNPTIA